MDHITMIDGQLRPAGVSDKAVLSAFKQVPREAFVPEVFQHVAYAESSIPLPGRRVLCSPLDCGRLLQGLEIEKTDQVLLVGGESGYLAALTSHLADEVTVVDPDEVWVSHLRELLSAVGVDCQCVVGDAMQGWSSSFDRIIVTGAIPDVPSALHDALKPGGKIFAVVGPGPARQATVFEEGGLRGLYETDMPLLPGVEENSFVF